MTDQDLARLWRDTEAPAHDLAFEAAVEEAIARRRLLIDMAGVGAAALAVGALVWALGPRLLATAGDLALGLESAGPLLAAVAAIGAAMAWFNRVPDEA